MRHWSSASSRGLADEVDVPGEHGRDAGDLLPLVHHVVARSVGLKVERDAAAHPRQNGEEVPAWKTRPY